MNKAKLILEKADNVHSDLSTINIELSIFQTLSKNYDKAKEYIEISIAYAKLVVKEEARTNCLCGCLLMKGKNCASKGNFKESTLMFEEAYNILAEKHNPIHPLVLEVADLLIKSLIFTIKRMMLSDMLDSVTSGWRLKILFRKAKMLQMYLLLYLQFFSDLYKTTDISWVMLKRQRCCARKQ